ncbi:hypothetical protein [Wielerella bovis]|nr:hypothetical protein [Wielerella bovis]
MPDNNAVRQPENTITAILYQIFVFRLPESHFQIFLNRQIKYCI